ncbi:MAG: HEPN domain-containing protein [Planctomycetota bacterium]
MLDAGYDLYVIFCSQQAIEKALKGLIVRRSGENPPNRHNLPCLAETAQLKLSPDRARFFLWLTVACVECRYPARTAHVHQYPDRHTAENVLRQTEETHEWLLTLL